MTTSSGFIKEVVEVTVLRGLKVNEVDGDVDVTVVVGLGGVASVKVCNLMPLLPLVGITTSAPSELAVIGTIVVDVVEVTVL